MEDTHTYQFQWAEGGGIGLGPPVTEAEVFIMRWRCLVSDVLLSLISLYRCVYFHLSVLGTS